MSPQGRSVELQGLLDTLADVPEDASHRLQDWTIRVYLERIEEVGQYLKGSFHQKVDDNLIIKLGSVLNGLYQKSDANWCTPPIKENIIGVLSRSYALIDVIDKKKRRGKAFYKDLIKLGEDLVDLHRALRLGLMQNSGSRLEVEDGL